MSEDRYRLCLIILLALFVIGTLIAESRLTENGRYVQFDRQKQTVVLPSMSSSQQFAPTVIDSRTGQVQETTPSPADSRPDQ